MKNIMSRTIQASALVLIVLMGFSGIPAMFAGMENTNASASTSTVTELSVDAWVLTKITKAGDTIQVFAKTSYSAGVSVTARVFRYTEPSFDRLYYYEAPTLNTETVTTLTMTYDSTTDNWTAFYTTPTTAHGGLYGVEVTATSGNQIAKDTPTIQLEKFYDDWIKPIIDDAKKVNNDINEAIIYVDGQIENFNDTINDMGGIKGIAENLTDRASWNTFITLAKNQTNISYAAGVLEELVAFLKTDEAEQTKEVALAIKEFAKTVLLEDGVYTKGALLLPVILLSTWSSGLSQTGGSAPPAISADVVAQDTYIKVTVNQGNAGDIRDLQFYVKIGAGDWVYVQSNDVDYSNGSILLDGPPNNLWWDVGESVCIYDTAITAANSSQPIYVKIIHEPTSATVFYNPTGVYKSTSSTRAKTDNQLSPSNQTKENITQAWEKLKVSLRKLNGTTELLAAFEKFLNCNEVKELNASIRAIKDSETKLSALYNAILTLDKINTMGYMEQNFQNLSNDVNNSVVKLKLFNILNKTNSDTFQEQMDIIDEMPAFQTWANEVNTTSVFPNLNNSFNSAITNITNKLNQTMQSANFTALNASFTRFGNYMNVSGNETMKHFIIETLDEAFYVCNVDLVASTEYFQEVSPGKNAVVNFSLTSSAGAIPNATIVATVIYVDPIEGQSMVKEGLLQQPQLSSLSELPIKFVYGGKTITDANGRASISFPLENYGIYAVIATTDSSMGTGITATAIFGERYVPKINLIQIGKFAGIPVFENPRAIGEILPIDVTLPSGINATVSIGVGPLNLKDLLGDINGVNYTGNSITKNTTGGTERFNLTVNGPISVIGVATIEPQSNGAMEVNVIAGILLSSQASVNVVGPTEILPGGTYTLTLSSEAGIVGVTYGVGVLSDGLDPFGIDCTQITKYLYGIATKRLPEPSLDVVRTLQSIVFGYGGTASVNIPSLASRGDYSIITVSTIIDNTGRKLAAVGFISPQIQGKVIGTTISSTTIGVEVPRPTVGLPIPIKVEGDGVAISGATVKVLKDGKEVKSTTTSGTGDADVILTTAGNYTISIEKDGYVLSEKNLTVGGLIPFDVTIITTEPKVGKTISIKVLNKENNTPVAWVKITLEAGDTNTSGTTGEDGIVNLIINKEGNYTLTVEKEGYDKTTTNINVVKEKKKESGLIPAQSVPMVITTVGALAVAGTFFRRRKL